MDTLIQSYSSSTIGFEYNHHSISDPSIRNHVNGYIENHSHTHSPILQNGSHPVDISPYSGVNSEGDLSEESDYYNGVLNYMEEMLMNEEDLENKPCMFHDCSALQAAEKSFRDVLVESPPSPNRHPRFVVDRNSHDSPGDDFTETCSDLSTHSSASVNNFVESDLFHIQDEFDPFVGQSDHTFHPNLQSFASSTNFYNVVQRLVDSPVSTESQLVSKYRDQGKVTLFVPTDNYANFSSKPEEKSESDHSPDGSRVKKNHYREDSDFIQEGRSNKQLASYDEESEQTEMYDKVLLCPVLLGHDLQNTSGLCTPEEASQTTNKLLQNGQSKVSSAGRPRGKKQGNKREVVDLRGLLLQCAQAVASNSIRTFDDTLKKIRQHSSPHGDGTERLAHYFANALEARLTGTGTTLYTAYPIKRISAAGILKAYHLYVMACPFHKMSNIFANKAIRKVCAGTTRLHIIDFGILYGFQWPCFVQGLSARPGGPPKLRITGIDFPQPGFRPTERVEETGRRLKNYCKRFNVPFEFNAIAKKWDTIQIEELKIDRDELLVVNSLFRLRNVPDETVVANSPRDAVLNLIKRINPDIFIHGVINGTHNAPFFVTRFREALFYYSTLFDIFEATTEREDKERLLFEQEIYARDAMNVIACEGTARIERPESYKQWQARNVRAGFKQLPLYQEIVKEVRAKVKLSYHKDFTFDVDNKWMLQGWKGRVIYALSLWKPIQD